MFHLDNNSGISSMPAPAAQQSSATRWFTEGSGTDSPSWPGQDWFNIVQAELLNVLAAAGIAPKKAQFNQLALAIKAIVNKDALLKTNLLREIKDAGAAAQKTARENLDITDAALNRKGLVQLNNSTNSASETQAATPKAVKAANDNANGRVPSGRKVNGHALTGDISVTSQDIFNGQSIEIGANQNLDNYQTPGIYFQPANANTSAALHYPENNAGALVVLKSAGVTQIYYVYNSSRIWTRSKYGTGAWTAWAREYNTLNKPTPGDIGAVNKAGDNMTGGLGVGGNLTLKGDQRLHFVMMNADGKQRAYIWKDKGGDGIHINNGIDGGGDYIFHKDGALRTQAGIYAGTARMASDGNIYGSVWGNRWLRDYLSATYQPKGSYGKLATANRAVNGWWKCGDTGLIIQWARYGKGKSADTYNFPLPMKFPGAGLFCIGYAGSALHYKNDAQSQSAHLVDNATVRVTVDNGIETVVLAIGF